MSIETIRGRLEAGTPGPWEVYDPQDPSEIPKGSIRLGVEARTHSVVTWGEDSDDEGVSLPADADLIAHAPTDLGLLLAVAEAARHFVAKHCYEDIPPAYPLKPECGSCPSCRLRATFRALEAAE